MAAAISWYGLVDCFTHIRTWDKSETVRWRTELPEPFTFPPINPNPEDVKIRRLRRLHRFKSLEAKPCIKGLHRKVVTNGNLTLC